MDERHPSETRQSPKLHFALIVIKFTHTAVWAFFVSCIVAIPCMALRKQFHSGLLLSLAVLAECLVILANRGKCPLTNVAARLTSNRQDNFDIYLPLWLAQRNKLIFGVLFVVGECFLLGSWVRVIK